LNKLDLNCPNLSRFCVKYHQNLGLASFEVLSPIYNLALTKTQMAQNVSLWFPWA